MQLDEKTASELRRNIFWALESSDAIGELSENLSQTLEEHNLTEDVRFYPPRSGKDPVIHMSVDDRRVSIRQATRERFEQVEGEESVGGVTIVGKKIEDPAPGWEATGVLADSKTAYHSDNHVIVGLIVDWMALDSTEEEFHQGLASLRDGDIEFEQPTFRYVSVSDRETFRCVLDAVKTDAIPEELGLRCLLVGMRRYLDFPVDELEVDLLSMLLQGKTEP
jgi:hypothetical protein